MKELMKRGKTAYAKANGKKKTAYKEEDDEKKKHNL